MSEPVMTTRPSGNGKIMVIAEQDGVTDFAIADTEREARTKALHRLQERINRWGWPR